MKRLILLTLFLLFSPVLAEPDPAACDTFHNLFGGEALAFVSYDQLGWNLPADIIGDGGFNFPADGGVSFYRSPSQPDYEWVFVFLSYEATTDAKGEHLGQHNLCGPYKVERAALKPLLQAHPSAAGYIE